MNVSETIEINDNTVQAQDIVKGMFLTEGETVFKVAKVIPRNLKSITFSTDDGVFSANQYTHVQVITARGRIINVPADFLFVTVPV